MTQPHSEQAARPHGTPIWNDVDAPDAAAARIFYTSLFGWNTNDYGSGMDGQFGTFFPVVDGSAAMHTAAGRHPAVWTTYFVTDDVDEAAAKVVAHGGQVEIPPTAVATGGSVALFVDPSGASFGVWQQSQGGVADGAGSHVKAIWNELHSQDVEAASRFYRAVFGWDAEATPFGEIDYTYWKLGDRLVAGGIPLAALMPVDSPSHWVAIFAVKSCDDMVARARRLQAEAILEPTRSEDGLYAFLKDPQGAVFGVISP